MIQIVAGNIIALIASVIMVLSGYIKEKKKILFAQTIQIGLSVVSNLVLGGYSGAIINAVNCVRNIICYKDKLGTKEKILLIVVSGMLTVIFNNLGWIGWLPLLSTVVYILFMNIENVIKFKAVIIFTILEWFIYDLYIKSYTAAIFDFLTIVTSIVAIIQIIKKERGE